MEKLKLRKNQYEAVCIVENKAKNGIYSAIQKRSEGFVYQTEEFKALNELSLKDLAHCALIGYELEQTPEEKLVEDFNNSFKTNSLLDIGFRHGIERALNILNIKIKSIND